jgi:hypothetical protein
MQSLIIEKFSTMMEPDIPGLSFLSAIADISEFTQQIAITSRNPLWLLLACSHNLGIGGTMPDEIWHVLLMSPNDIDVLAGVELACHLSMNEIDYPPIAGLVLLCGLRPLGAFGRNASSRISTASRVWSRTG